VKLRPLALLFALLCGAVATLAAQDSSSSPVASARFAAADTAASGGDADAPARAAFARRPWEYGPFFQGGAGVGTRSDYHFSAAGFRLGKVMTPQVGRGFFRGQFEFAGEVMPYWQAFTPAPYNQAETVYDPAAGLNYTYYVPYGGGTFTGVSLTPVIFHWDFKPGRRIAPWFQAAGGLIYTTHKFPPDVLVEHGQPGGTSVWNFSPQGGIGMHYFINRNHAITLSANGVHISSASLGDHNPGVNASVMFQIGYTFFGRSF